MPYRYSPLEYYCGRKKIISFGLGGNKICAPEADIFSVYKQPYFDLFLKRYCMHNPNYQVNQTELQYYLISRKLQDIFDEEYFYIKF